MFERIKDLGRGLLQRMGLLEEVKNITNHKKVTMTKEQHNRIMRAKNIYAGYVPEWHDVNYTNSNGFRQERTMMSLGMAKVVASEMASLLYSESCRFNIAGGEEEVVTKEGKTVVPAKKEERDFIESYMFTSKFNREFQRYLEYMLAMGGLAVKAYVDNSKDEPQLKFSYITADTFFPISNDSETVDEAVVLNSFQKGDKFYSLLEWNYWDGDVYVVENELYESNTQDNLGFKVSLSKMFPDLEKRTEYEGMSRPRFTYFKPNDANNKEISSPLGMSIFENAEDTLYQLDFLFDFFHHEFRLGRRRVAIPESMVSTRINENGQMIVHFDETEDLFEILDGESKSFEVKDLTVNIRSEDIINSINFLLETLSMQVGFSAGTFTFDGTSVKTATQVVSEDSKTFRTRNSHLTIINDGLKDLMISAIDLAVAEGILSSGAVLEEGDIEIDFDDGVFTDKQAEADYYSRILNMGVMPKREIIKRLFDLPDAQADEWLAEIKSETNPIETDKTEQTFESIFGERE